MVLGHQWFTEFHMSRPSTQDHPRSSPYARNRLVRLGKVVSLALILWTAANLMYLHVSSALGPEQTPALEALEPNERDRSALFACAALTGAYDYALRRAAWRKSPEAQGRALELREVATRNGCLDAVTPPAVERRHQR